jgi:hypothetical protein
MPARRPKPSPPPKGPAAYHQLGQVLRDLESDLNWGLAGSPRIPPEWHQIAQARVQPAKDKVTLRVDSDVLAFFRAMGTGHLTRMNDVLRAFMLARLAEVVKGQAVYAPPPEGEPLSAEEKRFFEFLEWLGRQELSEEAKAHFLMRYMEREKEGRG